MKLIFSYLKDRLLFLSLFLLFFLLCFALFFLYGLPFEAAFYIILLCLFFLIAACAADFVFYCKRHRLLASMQEEIRVSLFHLPTPHTQSEKDYQLLLSSLNDAFLQYRNDSEKKLADLTEYYTIWAHQIKTPIAAMHLMLQNDETPSPAALREELQRIEQYAEMVLCYLRLDSSSTDYVFQEYDLDGIIKQAVRHYASQFIRKKIHLDYTPIHYQVLTDEKWLLFVIEQVLSNALKYTPSGSIAIFMEEDGALCIRDTGIGIAPEDLPRIFENGYTGYNGRSDKKATGIGLYLCRRICHSLGHDIYVRSEKGNGTTVRISLKREPLEVE